MNWKFTMNINNMNAMRIIALSMALMLLHTLAAQPPLNPDKLKKEKTEYMKKRLALTTAEEKSFIPVYEKFTDEMFSHHREGMEMMRDYDLTFADDTEAEKQAQKLIAHKQRESEILKRYYAEFKKVLPVKKAAMVFKVEHDFRREMLKGMRKGKGMPDMGE